VKGVLDPIGSTPEPATSVGQNLLENQQLGRDAFLKLLVSQLKYQDPMEPVKNEAFVAQLAQFSSLEQLQSINETLAADRDGEATLAVRQAVESNTAVALIGKEVSIPAETVNYVGDGSVEIGYYLGGPADRVTVQVFDAAGNPLRILTDSSPEGGNGSVLWDGKDADGQQVDSGVYHIVPTAVDGQGQAVGASAALVGEVMGVRYEDGEPILILDGGEAPLSGVAQITQGE
jgi:flagellar basal-body rod modification protein FlgD